MAKKYKSVSGKKGSLMETAGDPDFGKNTIGDPSGNVSMYTPDSEIPISDAEREKELLQAYLDKSIAKELEVEEYNNNIDVLESDYKRVNPNNYVLVRLLHAPVREGDLIIENLLQLPKKSQTPGPSGEFQEHPFPHLPVGIVVRSGVDSVNEGDVVTLRGDVLQISFNHEKFEYVVHTQFRLPWDKRKISGYALIGNHSIAGTLDMSINEVWKKINNS